MVRTVFWFIYFFGYLVFVMPSLWKANKLMKNNLLEEHRQHVETITGNWARSLLKVAGVKVEVKGLENIPEEACLFVSNHQGNFDIPLLIGTIPRKLSFISKIEVKKIPIIPLWMEHMQCIFMDRKNRRQAIKAIIDGAKKTGGRA
ncbi:MAG: 1-acyl-sn-glycerol-3-phosphate acyltransferase [Bacillus sp. (in: Bacteria)]|nr:1-acyl-sn-glycerol-3-phosphate acyltransferase [Bacillus sp. (in: firmicutes)]